MNVAAVTKRDDNVILRGNLAADEVTCSILYLPVQFIAGKSQDPECLHVLRGVTLLVRFFCGHLFLWPCCG